MLLGLEGAGAGSDPVRRPMRPSEAFGRMVGLVTADQADKAEGARFSRFTSSLFSAFR